ncbi:MAG: hypothetical protein K9M99_13350 [Candidatus Cloacimonetes bacterium]|nr:hypothetical protein [Candidatus Cloacimonadota bacterium]
MKDNNHSLPKEYLENKVFDILDDIIGFYDDLSFNAFGFLSKGVQGVAFIDTYFYSSIQGTLDSINLILKQGRINDSFALLRKYYDSCIINIYIILYSDENCSSEHLIVEEINNWVKGRSQLPSFGIMRDYIKNSQELKDFSKLLNKDNIYKIIKDRCNDHVHYNYYQYALLNDNNIHQERMKPLNDFTHDLERIFVLHLSYIFNLCNHYIMSSNYRDCMDCGIKPPEGCEYWVAPFVQEIFDKYVKRVRPDIAEYIKKHTEMELE